MQDEARNIAEQKSQLEKLRRQIVQLEEELVERRHVEDALRQETELLHGLIDTLPDYIFIKDRESRFVLSNRAHLGVLGVTSPKSVMGKTDFDIFPHELAVQYYADEQQIITSGEPLVGREESTITPDGRALWLSTTKVPLRDRNGTVIGLAGMSRNISERKAAQEALANSFEELEQFAYMVSFEMQDPLNAIADDLAKLEARLGDRVGDASKAMIARLRSGSTSVQSLSTALLDYSRMGAWGTLCAPTDSQEVLEHVLETLHERLQQIGATVRYDRLPVIYADTSQLLQLFQNLIANAIAFRAEAPLQIRIEAEADGKEWRFCVSDNGIGFDPQFRDRIFAPFQRVHDQLEPHGTGIGLAICKRIIENHGGRIWAESAPGKGAAFYFTLPAAP